MLKRFFDWLFLDRGKPPLVDQSLSTLIRLCRESTHAKDALVIFTEADESSPTKVFVASGQFADYLESAALEARDRMMSGGEDLSRRIRSRSRRNPSRKPSDAELSELRKITGLDSKESK